MGSPINDRLSLPSARAMRRRHRSCAEDFHHGRHRFSSLRRDRLSHLFWNASLRHCLPFAGGAAAAALSTPGRRKGQTMSSEYAGKVDFIEAGDGPLVVLVHASMAGARQWSSLISDLGDRFRVRAVNLFGYGGTPAWSGVQPPTLDDFAALVARVVPAAQRNVLLVGHAFGGAVAMHATARQLRGQVERLVLIEPSLFYLLEQNGARAAFHEVCSLARFTKQRIAAGAAHDAAGRFIDYWSGRGNWAEMPENKK